MGRKKKVSENIEEVVEVVDTPVVEQVIEPVEEVKVEESTAEEIIKVEEPKKEEVKPTEEKNKKISTNKSNSNDLLSFLM